MSQHKKKEIAAAFSTGKFEMIYGYMADDITWVVVGESEFSGKVAVIENCKKTAAYFSSVTTVFNTAHIIAENNKVAISGTAEFIRNNKRVAFIRACDVYEFNKAGFLQTITSYCIPDK